MHVITVKLQQIQVKQLQHILGNVYDNMDEKTRNVQGKNLQTVLESFLQMPAFLGVKNAATFETYK